MQNTLVKLIFTICCVQNTKYNIINRTRKNDVKTVKKIFLIENPFFRVQITMPGKNNFFLCAKDDLLCAKAIFPKEIEYSTFKLEKVNLLRGFLFEKI